MTHPNGTECFGVILPLRRTRLLSYLVLSDIVHYLVCGFDYVAQVVVPDLPLESSGPPVIIGRVLIQILQLLCQSFVHGWRRTLELVHPSSLNPVMFLCQQIRRYLLDIFHTTLFMAVVERLTSKSHGLHYLNLGMLNSSCLLLRRFHADLPVSAEGGLRTRNSVTVISVEFYNRFTHRRLHRTYRFDTRSPLLSFSPHPALRWRCRWPLNVYLYVDVVLSLWLLSHLQVYYLTVPPRSLPSHILCFSDGILAGMLILGDLFI